jgi:hypothetical protein
LVDLLRYRKSVIDLNAKMPDGAVTEEGQVGVRAEGFKKWYPLARNCGGFWRGRLGRE